MDDLKKYLQHNREQLDTDTPAAGLLQRIQKQAAVNKKGRLYTMLVRVSVAACVIAVIFLSVQLLLQQGNKEQAKVSSATPPPAETNRSPGTHGIDTLQQLVKAENQVTIEQQKNREDIKQLPVSYQLLNSFEQNYTKLVNLQLKNIRNTPVYGESPDYFNGFKIRMRQIDEDEVVIKRQIKTNGLKDELLEQLINLYQEKINLLKDLQHEIGSMNNKIKENRQPADSTRAYYINI